MIHIAPRTDFQAAANPAQILSGIGSALRTADGALAQPGGPVREQYQLGMFQDLVRDNHGGRRNRFSFHLYQFNTIRAGMH